jgi:hypothetical protein
MFKTRLVTALVIATLTTSTVAQTATRSAPPTPTAPIEYMDVFGKVTPAPAPTPAKPAQPAPAKKEAPVDLATIIMGVGILALIANELTSGSAPARSSSNKDLTWLERQRNENNRAAERNKPDTSVGCAWGDRSYGTCR